ncbi:MAG: hypothetical protein RL527_861 [Planctomycetota bacterium]|jgi:zinc and cadmium transporter
MTTFAAAPSTVLAAESALVVAASLIGAWVGTRRLAHTPLQLVLSAVSGMILGIVFFHLLPHALGTHGGGAEPMDVMLWALIGFMALFVLERFAPFHAHEHGAGGDCGGGSCGHVAHTCDHEHDHAPHAHADAHTHAPRLGWMGALLGLTVHSLMEGVALAASVQAESSAGWLAGLGTLLVIVAHKPFDAMTLAALLRQDRVDAGKAVVIQVLFSLVMPLGAFLFMAGVRHDPQVTALALAFSGGVFLCIACSDLLPEVQFHRHDRLKLTAALVGGILLAWGMSRLEATLHDHGDHDHGAASSHEGHDHGAPASSTDGHDHGSHDGHDH